MVLEVEGAARGDRQLRADLWLFFITVIWGSTFVLVKDTLSSLGPFGLVALRFTVGLIALMVLFGRRLRRASGREIAAGALIGLFLFAGYAFQTVGLKYTSAAKSGFITGLSIVIVPVVAYLVLRHRPGVGAVLGVVSATVGLALLTLKADLSIEYGDLITMGCTISFALQIVLVGKFAPRMDAVVLTTAQIATVSLVSALLAGYSESLTLPLPLEAWAAVVFLGLAATALTFSIQNVAQKSTTPTHAALIFSLEPVFSLVFAYLLAGETLTGRALVGSALIVLGMIRAELKR